MTVGRPQREPKEPSALAPQLLAFARARGVPHAPLASRCDVMADPDAAELAVDAGSLKNLFEAVADATGEPFVGLRLLEPDALPTLRGYSPVELAVRAAPTAVDALGSLARYAPLIHPHVTAERVDRGEELSWVCTARARVGGVGVHADHYCLGFVLAQCRAVAGDDLAPTRVTFQHARPRDVAPLHRFFGTRALTFGAESSSLSFSRARMETRAAAHDPRLLSTATALAEGVLARHAPATRAASMLQERLPLLLPDRATLDIVARELAMSSRTLQRRLDEEGTTFLEVLDGVREARARQELRQRDTPLVEIAERLGFSDLATFSRAFKRWTGEPPGLFRRNRAG
jgi:AraC-like DNA-binding protein